MGGLFPVVQALFAEPGIGTKVVVGLNLLQFALAALVFGPGSVGFLGGGPAAIGAGALSGQLDGESFRFLSAVYVHFGLLHLGMNMLGIWQLGREVEGGLGVARFFTIYTLTGLAGFFASDLFMGGSPYLTAGASGAWFGLLGVKGAFLVARKDPRAKEQLLSWAAYAVGFALLLPVNNAAHAGGFATGFALGFAFYKERRPWKLENVFRVVTGVLLAATLASLVLAWTSPVVAEVRVLYANPRGR